MKPGSKKTTLDRAPDVGLTGGLACGKSTVGGILSEAGVAVLDADDVAHRMMRPGGELVGPVKRLFGPEVLGRDGGVDRRALARLVFSDPGALAALNALAHPPVLRRCRRWRQEQQALGRPSVTIVPLLYEAGDLSGWDAVICVTADETLVRERLKNRGWTAEETAARRAAQWPIAEKEKRANFVIENNGTLDAVRERTLAVWRALLNRKEQGQHG